MAAMDIDAITAEQYEAPAGAVAIAARSAVKSGSGEPSHVKEDSDERPENMLVPVQFVLALAIVMFLLPITAAFAAFIMDIEMMTYINNTIDDYKYARKVLRREISDSQFATNIVYLARANRSNEERIANTRELDFIVYLQKNTSCPCVYVNGTKASTRLAQVCSDTSQPSVDGAWAVNLTDANSVLTTHNLYEACEWLEAEDTWDALRLVHCNCGSNVSPFKKTSPQFGFVSTYDTFYSTANHKEYKSEFCSLNRMLSMVRESGKHKTHQLTLGTLKDCYNSCWAFLVIGGVSACLYGWGHTNVRATDVRIVWKRLRGIVKNERPHFVAILYGRRYVPTTAWYRHEPRAGMGRDQFTVFVCSTLMYHILCNLSQAIVAVVFLLTKQGLYVSDDKDAADAANTGTDCVEDWAAMRTSFGRELAPPLASSAYAYVDDYTKSSGQPLIEAMLQDSGIMKSFFTATLLATFFDGLFLIRLFDFDTQKILEYEWWRNCGYLLMAVALALLFLVMIYSPLCYVVWFAVADSSLMPAWIGLALVVAGCFYAALCALPMFFCCCCSMSEGNDCDMVCANAECECCDCCG